MNTEKPNFWCKKSYKDCTHHTLLLNLTQQWQSLFLCPFYICWQPTYTGCSLEPARKTLAIFRARRQTPCWLCHLSHVTVTGRIMKNRSFVDIPLPKRRKKICKGMAKEDGRIPTMSYQQIWLACLLSRKAAAWGDPWMSRIPVDSTFISMFYWHGNGSKWDSM